MTDRIIGSTGSRRRRRVYLFAPLIVVLALVLPGLVFSANLPQPPATTCTTPTSAPNCPQFEVDGNKVSENAGTIDWATGSAGSGVVTATRITSGADSGKCNQTNSQVLGGPGVVGGGVLVCDGSVGTDKPLNNGDANAFVQGQHEEESPDKANPTGSSTVAWNIEAASSPKKTDLAEVLAYAKVGDSAFDTDSDVDDLFLFVDATRLDINGDFHVDFELNQVARTDCGDSIAKTFCQKRTAGDVIVSFDTISSGELQASFYVYTTTDSPTCATSSAGIGVPPGCYVLVTNPNLGPNGELPSFALFNGAEINSPPWQSVGCDPVTGDNKQGCKLRTKMPPGGDMEGYIDVTAFLPNLNLCPGFGQINPKSRSSSGINASLQDDAGAVPFNVSICKSLLIRKEAKNANTTATDDLLGGATFTITPDPISGTGSLDVTDGDSNDLNSTAGLVCVKVSATGTFKIEEKTAPANYKKDSTVFSSVAPTAQDCAARNTAAGNENAKFVNTPLSSIEVKFSSDAGAGVTKASIACSPQGTTTEQGAADPALDDTDETFSELVPNTYTCTVVIDP